MSSCCHCAAPEAHPRAATDLRPPAWGRIAFASLVAAQSMIFSLAINLSPPAGSARLFLHGALALSALVVFLLVGLPLVRAALQPRITFEQLFLIGILAAFSASLVSTFTGVGHVYYEVVAILLAIYTLGRTLGENRRRAALDAALTLGAEFETCERIADDGSLATVPVRTIRSHDLVHIPAGGGVAIDGVVMEGSALVRENALTGEPFPLTRRPGDPVLAGSHLLDGHLRVRATADGDARLLDAIFARVRAAQARPSRLQREADRLVAWFLPAVLLIATVTFVGWSLHSGWTVGLFNALAVLLVACPCSMGLATPISVWSALADLGRHGLIASQGDLVERLAQVQQVIFDKTGTLGDEHLELVDFVTVPGLARETLLGEVAALEAATSHPIARAFRHHPTAGPAKNLRVLPGIGIAGHIAGHDLEITNEITPALDDVPLRAQLRGASAATRELFITRDGALAGLALLREQLRDSAPTVLADLEAAGLPCTVLTGDRSAPAQSLPRIETGLTPLEKASRVRALTSSGPVLFVGDGVNDAPAMAASHISLALATGSPLARDTAMGEFRDLRVIPLAIARCRGAVRIIRQNLLFAAAYNAIGIALAAAGILHPITAALLMLASSLTVSWRALRPVKSPFTLHPPSPPHAISPHLQPA